MGLDLGRVTHRNPSSECLVGTHKHRWTDVHGDKQAYQPEDITAEWYEPVQVWEQFCAEIKLEHDGTLPAPFVQEELPL